MVRRARFGPRALSLTLATVRKFSQHKMSLSAVAAAGAGQGEMHYGICGCPKSPLVTFNGRSSDMSGPFVYLADGMLGDMTVCQDATTDKYAYSMAPCVNVMASQSMESES